MLSVIKPERIFGITRDYTDEDLSIEQVFNKSRELYITSLSMQDSFGLGHTIDINKIHQQIWKERLAADIERFIAMVQDYISKKTKPNNLQ